MASPSTIITNTPTPITSTCNALQGDSTGYAIIATCTGTPPTTASIFQHGCIMIQTNTSTGSTAVYQNTGSIAIPAWTLLASGGAGVSATGPNYVVGSGSSANTIVGALTDGAGTAVPLAAGLHVLVKADSTLQAGANTFNLNGGGAVAIVTNTGRNLKTIYLTGAILDLVYDGTNWQMINSTTLIT